MTQAPATRPKPQAPAPDDLLVKCVGLTKVFRDFWLRNRVKAVDNIDLDVRRGEVFGLLGPNGSGKSTTIKMILGLLHPTAGRIAVFGKHPCDVAIKRDIGYLPEESYLYRFLSARETLEYYGRLFHQDRARRRRRIDMLLEMVGLDKVARRPVGEFSKGMQRRIGLAQALINDPQLLILDEPTTGMDPIGTRQIKDLLLQLAERGKTIILCSHLLADVEDVCDRASVMFGGRVRVQGPMDELLSQPGLTTIKTENLSPEAIAEIEAVLAKHGRHIESVEHPRQKLEAFFLDIVEKAQREGLATSGASSGGRIAEFLVRGEGAPADQSQGEAMLDALVSPQPQPQPEVPASADQPPAAEAPEGAAPAEEPEESAVLDQLVGGAEAPGQPAPGPPADDDADRPQPRPGAAPPEEPQEQPDESLIDALVDPGDRREPKQDQ